MVAHALVHALVVTAEDDQIAHHRQVVGHALRQLLTVGRGEDHFVVVALRLQRGYAAVDRLYLHHHTSLTSKGIVIDTAPLVERIVTKIVQMDFRQTLLGGPGKDGFVDEAFQHFGKDADNVYSHKVQS